MSLGHLATTLIVMFLSIYLVAGDGVVQPVAADSRIVTHQQLVHKVVNGTFVVEKESVQMTVTSTVGGQSQTDDRPWYVRAGLDSKIAPMIRDEIREGRENCTGAAIDYSACPPLKRNADGKAVLNVSIMLPTIPMWPNGWPDPATYPTVEQRNQRYRDIAGEARVQQQPIVDLLHKHNQTLVGQQLHVNYVDADVTADLLPKLEDLDIVQYVHSRNHIVSSFLLESRQITGVEQYKNLLNDGTNTIIGVIDSGIDIVHGTYDDSSNTATALHRSLDDLDDRPQSSDPKLNKITDNHHLDEDGNNPEDCNGHGTQVAGVALATGGASSAHSGYAPQAKLNAYKTTINCDGDHDTNAIVSAIEEAITDNVDVLNLSLGTNNTRAFPGTDSMSRVVDRAYNSGISVTISAGNYGHNVSSPGVAHKALTLGATSQDRLDVRMPYSNYGGTADGRIKPDLMAPVDTIYDINGGMVVPTLGVDQYAAVSGTSFAAPQAAGAIADLIEKYQRNRVTLEPGRIYAMMLSQAMGNATGSEGLRMDNEIGAGVISMRHNTLETRSGHTGFSSNGSATLPINVPANVERMTVALWWPEDADDDHSNVDLEIYRNSARVAGSTLDGTVTQRLIVEDPVAGTGAYSMRISSSSSDNDYQNVYYSYTFALPNNPPAARSQEISVAAGAQTEIVVSGTDSDRDNVGFFVSRPPPADRATITPTSGSNRYLPYVSPTSASLTYAAPAGTSGTDSFQITPWDGLDLGRPATVTVTVTQPQTLSFTASLTSLIQITIAFSERLNTVFSTDQFSISSGTITGVRNFEDSRIRYLYVSGISADADVTVTYLQTRSDLVTSPSSKQLVNGTQSTAKAITVSPPNPPAPATNRPPVADAGGIQHAVPGDVVVLHGTATDPDGNSLTYAWTQRGGPSVTLSGAATLTPSFTAPDVSTSTLLRFRLVATESGTTPALSDRDSTSVRVRPVVSGVMPESTVTIPNLPSYSGYAESISSLGSGSMVAGAPSQRNIVFSSSGKASASSGDGLLAGVSEGDVAFERHRPAGADRDVGFFVRADTGNRITTGIPIYGEGDDTSKISGPYIVEDGHGTLSVFAASGAGGAAASGASGSALLATVYTSGAAYVHDLRSGTYVQISNPLRSSAHFGASVDSSADSGMIVVGAPRQVQTINGVTYSRLGTAYVYNATGPYTSYVGIENPHPANRDRFGTDVEFIGSDMVAVSSQLRPRIDIMMTNGTLHHPVYNMRSGHPVTASDMAHAGGDLLLVGDAVDKRAYLFNATAKATILTLSADSSTEPFGDAVASYGEKYAVSGKNGAVYVFDSLGNKTLKIPKPGTGTDDFGSSLSFIRGKLLVGAPETHVAGVSDAGAAYLYSSHTGSLIANYTNTDPNHQEEMGNDSDHVNGKTAVAMHRYRGNADGTGAVLLYAGTNTAPVSDAGFDLSLYEGAAAALNGTMSYDPDGDLITHNWTQVSGPVTVRLSDGRSATPSFAAPQVSSDTVLTFSLVTGDGLDSSTPDNVDVTVLNTGPPAAPAGLSTIPLNSTAVVLVWIEPESDGGSAVTGYRIERKTAGSYAAVSDDTGTAAVMYTDTGLAPATTYTYRVSAVNAAGTGPASMARNATTPESPDTTPPVITVQANITVAATGTLTKAAVQNATATDPSQPVTISSNATAQIKNGFPVGVTVIQWSATDAVGNRATAYQSVTVINGTVPSASVSGIPALPPSLLVNADQRIRVSFGENVTGFEGSDVVVTNATVHGFAGNGSTYTFTVQTPPSSVRNVTVSVPAGVANSAGSGLPNSASNTVSFTVDKVPPTFTAITFTNLRTMVTFSEPVGGTLDMREWRVEDLRPWSAGGWGTSRSLGFHSQIVSQPTSNTTSIILNHYTRTAGELEVRYLGAGSNNMKGLADGAGNALSVANVTSKHIQYSIENIANVSGSYYSLDVDGDYAYPLHRNWWGTVIDVSNKSAPVLSDTRIGRGQVMLVDGNHSYMGDRHGSVEVFDISDKSAPERIGRVSTANLYGIESLDVEGDYLYASSDVNWRRISSSGHVDLSIIDISNKSNPVVVGNLSDSRMSGALHVDADGDYVYVAGSRGLTSIDVSNKSNPAVADHVAMGGAGRSRTVTVHDGYAYVGLGGLGLLGIADISDPSNMDGRHGSASPGHAARFVVVAGDYAYTLSSHGGIVQYDISDPRWASWTHIITGLARTWDADIDVSDDGRYLYTSTLRGFRIFETSQSLPEGAAVSGSGSPSIRTGTYASPLASPYANASGTGTLMTSGVDMLSGDSVGPSPLYADLDMAGILSVTFDEPVSNSTDPSRMYVEDPGSPDRRTALSGNATHPVGYPYVLSIALDDSQKHAVLAMSSPHLNLSDATVLDMANNTMDAVNGIPVSILTEPPPPAVPQRMYPNATGIHDNSILVSWIPVAGGADRYKAVIVDPNGTKYADGNIPGNATAYRFVDLEPGTEYEIRVGIRGDDSTQGTIHVRTAPWGTDTFDPGLSLHASLEPNSDRVGLSWTDSNGIGEDRYRIERSVDGGPYELTDLRPRFERAVQDTVRPGWLGKDVRYTVFERLGGQKLISGAVQITLPATLLPPQNLTASLGYKPGAGLSLDLDWDAAPLYRNYIVEIHDDADSKVGWSRLAKIQTDSYSHPIDTDAPAKFRVYSQLGSAASVPSEVEYRPSDGGVVRGS